MTVTDTLEFSDEILHLGLGRDEVLPDSVDFLSRSRGFGFVGGAFGLDDLDSILAGSIVRFGQNVETGLRLLLGLR